MFCPEFLVDMFRANDKVNSRRSHTAFAFTLWPAQSDSAGLSRITMDSAERGVKPLLLLKVISFQELLDGIERIEEQRCPGE